MNQQLQDYIKQARKNGMPDEQIRSELLNTGWQGNDIDEALANAQSTPEKAPGQPVFKSFKDWKLRHSIFWAIILSITLIIITRYIASGTPGLNIFYLLTLWFVAPILIFGAIYKSLARKPKDIVNNSSDDPIKINKKQAKLLLILLALEIPVLLLMSYVYLGNEGSRYGDYGVLIFIFGVTLFVPNLIAFIIFGLGYIKGVFRYWRQLSKYNKASSVIFLLQFAMYLMFLSYF